MKNLQLSELTLENVGQWPLVVKYLSAALLAILILGLGYWLIIKHNFELYDTLKNDEQTLKAQFEYKQQLAANLQSYKNQLQIMNERFGNMLKQLPAQNEMPGLLEDISKTGIASGLTFELFAPMPEVVHDFYIELPINIKVVGDYHQLALFLSRVTEMPRIVTLHDFQISVVSKDKDKEVEKKQQNHGELLQMEITAKIYRYRK
jgi:type IV pilus assembly protein PilO